MLTVIMVAEWTGEPVPLQPEPIIGAGQLSDDVPHDELEEVPIIEREQFVDTLPAATHELVHDLVEPFCHGSIVAVTELHEQLVE